MWSLGALGLAVLTVGIDGTVLRVALPTLAKALHASKSDLQWFSSGYFLLLAAAMLLAGLLGDRYGYRRSSSSPWRCRDRIGSVCALHVGGGVHGRPGTPTIPLPDKEDTSMSEISPQPIAFTSDGVQLAGNLYLPGEGRYPGVVVAGTWTSVKEQMANRYAERLASRGYAALSFDFAGFGASNGKPRDCESPASKIRNIHDAVTFLAAHPAIDPHRLATLGVCASAGYMAVNAAADQRVKALAIIAPWVHDRNIVEDLYGGPQGVATKIAAGNAARDAYEQTGEVQCVPTVGAGNPLAAMPFDIDFYQNPARGAVPQWPNRFAVMSWTEWLTFDPIAVARRITVPTLMVHSEQAAIPQGAHRFYGELTSAKTEIWGIGDQFAYYDGEPQVTQASDAAATHFGKYLN
jgi:fermentation-respiration switch protein FrsA (DUF1100 family)